MTSLPYDLYLTVKSYFWADKFWLPPNTTWSILDRNETNFYPHSSDLWIPLPIAVFLFLLRLLWERFVLIRLFFYPKLKNIIVSLTIISIINVNCNSQFKNCVRLKAL